jgi:hypothetical protein
VKYNLIRIKINSKGNWEMLQQTDNEERIKGDTKPNPLGFYYYPQTMSKEDAFKELKNYMIKTYYKKIKELSKSLEKLINFEL